MSDCNASSVERCGLLGPTEPELQEVQTSLIPVVIRVALAAIMIFMITIGFLGNSIVCLIVYQKPAMRSAINLLLATLAFSDIMLSLLCMPFTAVTVASTDWSFRVGFCRASVMLYWFFVLEGVSILLIISVDRFLIIVQRQDKLTPHRAKVLIAASWALSFCVALPSIISWRTGIIMERVPQCILGYSESLAERGYMVLLAVAVFFVPFSVMLYSYMCILNTVRRNALRIHTHVAENNVGLKLGLTGLQRPPQVNVDMSFKTRAFTTILILFIGFSVCWLPHTVKKIKTDDSGGPDHLTELYIQHVIPLPQRELPNNRWGRRVEKTSPHRSLTTAHSSSVDSGRKRPMIVFDGSSTKTGSIKLKRTDDLPATDRLKSPPSSIKLSNPIRKLSSSSTNSPSSQASAGGSKSPTGNGSLNSPSAPSSVQSNCMSTKLKRGATSSGGPESPELKSPEVKKKIQHVTWP